MLTNDLSIIQKEVLRQIPKGNKRPVKSKEIAERTGLSQREVMSVIHILILNHGIPIGAGRKEGNYGYYIIRNEKERQQAIIPLQHSITNMSKRVEKLKSISLNQ
ncbi:hypothetical protein GCM10008929_20150 [Alkalibacterium psychrotolerans]